MKLREKINKIGKGETPVSKIKQTKVSKEKKKKDRSAAYGKIGSTKFMFMLRSSYLC